MLGYTEAELLAQPLEMLLHPDDLAASNLLMKSFVDGEEAKLFENRIITKIGKVLWLSWKAHLNARDGLFFCVAKDITARELADSLLIESEGRYSDLFQLSPLSKFVFDVENLQILDVNEAASKQYGYTQEEFLQMSIKQLRPAEEIPLALEVLDQLKQTKGTTKQHAIVHQKKNGKKIIVDIQSNPLLYKGKSARIAVATDITETLTHIQAIETQNEKLREISWLQSHVVRAPLARILGLIALLDISADLPEETKEMMGYILKSAHELDSVIHDIVNKSAVIDPKEK